MIMRALISVSDKTGIVEFVKELVDLDVEIVATDGLKKILDEKGIPAMRVEDVTNFPEMLDGRVKTLHPKIHGGLLARRDLESHMDTVKEYGIALIDLVVVNLYPFKETIAREDCTFDLAIENIDIGGPSMLRSAAKNHQSVTVVVDPNDYGLVLNELKTQGHTTLKTRQRLAAKTFRHTASYDALIAGYLTEELGEELPEKLTLTYDLKQGLRYGENAQQKAEFYQSAHVEPYSIANATQLHGKELSYNNIKDADAALKIAREFNEPTAVALKHMNPCGVGQATSIEEAFERCYQADPVSIFGGIVVLNRAVNMKVAEKLANIFLEIIIAPYYEEDALQLLSQKKNIRLLKVPFDNVDGHEKEVVSVLGGLLVQEQDWKVGEEKWEVMSEREATDEERKALEFGWKVVKHVKSNAIVVALDGQTVGIGAGQMNRVGAAKIALEQAKNAGVDLSKAILASDAFFPMNDTVELANTYGIRAIIQPGGSIKDQDSIDLANKYNMAMIKTDVRHFRH
ncbi:bifunctional phosphoribosylaminoimidazolecarboxamide formyltransferase/IMP cyclohydrolase [Granulicatella sp. WM01]|nr:bifunctional phosphoribosylaminoimidazolecarboxamide formyltransferase/IMP cyclohydrolase [Granulicatella sp. WM01]